MKKTVLIVDDFENTLFITQFTLSNAGFKVLKAKSGKEGLQHLEENKVDLIITDYNMPEMNGLEFVSIAKKMPAYTNVPVFILSTEIKKEIKEEAFKIGITSWISKPFKIDELLKLVRKITA